jgi:hypothetical protein
MLREKHCSTFVGLQLPQTLYEPASLISLGDSSAIQVRREQDETRVNVLQRPNTLWFYLLDQYPEIEGYVQQQQQGKTLSFEQLDLFYQILKPHLKGAFSLKKNRKAFKASLRQATQEGNMKEFQFKVFLLLDRLKDQIVLDLASPRRDVEQVIGWGKWITFQPGDDFVLHTDGMDVPHEDLAAILKESNPVEAAERLVKASKRKDDRAVVVVRVKKGMQQQALQDSVRLSMHRDQSLHSEAS